VPTKKRKKKNQSQRTRKLKSLKVDRLTKRNPKAQRKTTRLKKRMVDTQPLTMEGRKKGNRRKRIPKLNLETLEVDKRKNRAEKRNQKVERKRKRMKEPSLTTKGQKKRRRRRRRRKRKRKKSLRVADRLKRRKKIIRNHPLTTKAQM